VTRLLAWAGIVIGIVYLEVLGGSWDGIYLSALRIDSVGMAAIGLVIWGYVAWRSTRWRPRSVLMPAILAALGSLAISTVFSRGPRISLEYLAYTIVLAALYLLLVRLFADSFFRRRLESLAALLFVGISALFIGLVIAHWIRWWGAVGHLTVPPLRPEFEGLTYGNPSAVLTLVALLAMPTVASVRGSTQARAAGWLAILIVVGIVALVSGSRAGWLALGLTAVILPIVWLLSPQNRESVRNAIRAVLVTPRSRALAGAGLIVVVAVMVAVTPTIIRRAGEGGEALRADLAVVSLRIFGESPIVGTGPGTWVIERPGATLASEIDYYIPHAHNLEVQTLAELGLVGAAAGFFLAMSLIRLIRKGARDPDEARRRWAWAAGIGLLYFTLHQLLDFYPNLPGILFAAAIPVAYLDATSPERGPQPAPSWVARLSIARPAAFMATLLAFIAVVGLLVQELPAVQLARAAASADVGDWTAADGPARAAAAADPEVAAYDFTAGLTAAHAGDYAASAGYFEAVVIRTDLPEAWLNLAAEQVALGRQADAAASLQLAARLGIQRTGPAMAIGELARSIGLKDLAIDAFAAAVALSPSIAADPWWHSDPNRAALYPAVLARAIARGGSEWEIVLISGDLEHAATLAADLGGTAPEITAAWGGDGVALGELFDQCRASPLDALTSWCARLADRSGDSETANQFRYIADTANTGSFELAGELRVTNPPPNGESQGSTATFWGTYTYRRPTPGDVLVPSLVHLELQ